MPRAYEYADLCAVPGEPGSWGHHPRQIERKAAMSEFVTAPHFVSCPDRGCGCIAEVTDRFDLHSTDGLISHVETYCVRRHVFRLPAYRVIPA
jgi:hypothetical protein